MAFVFNLINKKVISRVIVSILKQTAIERNHEWISLKLKLHEKVASVPVDDSKSYHSIYS